MSHIPAYKEVYSKLKEELKEGIYPAGSLLPTESELEKFFMSVALRSAKLSVFYPWKDM